MTFELITKQAKDFKSIVDILLIAGDIVAIEIAENGMRAQTKDAAKTLMTDIFVYKDYFDSYSLNEESVFFYVDLLNMSSFVKLAKNDDELTIRYNTDKEVIEMVLKSDKMIRNTDLRLVASPDEEGTRRFLNILNRSFFHSELVLTSNIFLDAMKVATAKDEEVTLTNNKDEFLISVLGSNKDKTSETRIIYDNNEDVEVKKFLTGQVDVGGRMMEVPSKHSASFHLATMSQFLKSIKSGTEIAVSIINQGPMRVSSQIGEDEQCIKYAIAIAPINITSA